MLARERPHTGRTDAVELSGRRETAAQMIGVSVMTDVFVRNWPTPTHPLVVMVSVSAPGGSPEIVTHPPPSH